MKLSTLIKWHRRLGWVAGAGFLLWGLSGLLHPLMTWTNPRPATMAPPVQDAAAATDLTLPSNLWPVVAGLADIAALRVMPDGLIQVTRAGQGERTYHDPHTGLPVPDADRAQAVMLARHYTGATDAVAAATPLEGFTEDYPYINRYLPVWRVAFDRPDGLVVYVETQGGRLASISDRRKALLQCVFQNVHAGRFLDGWEYARLALITLMVGSIPLIAAAGLGLLWRRRGQAVGTGKGQGLRRGHKILAFVVWLPMMFFPVSGLFHLLAKSPVFYEDAVAPSPVISGAAVAHMPVKSPDGGDLRDVRLLVAPDGEGWWRVAQGVAPVQVVRYTSARTGRVIAHESAFAQHVAAVLAGVSPSAMSMILVTRFGTEYGFANKRLPVWRASLSDPQAPVYFIEPQTATLAARITPLDRAEGFSFSMFHKWQFLDGWGAALTGPGRHNQQIRDAIQVAFVLGALLSTVIGLRLMVRTRSKGWHKERDVRAKKL